MRIKLIADVMLGRLARWLRILGIDTLYNPYYDDSYIIYLSNHEKRCVLTRDRELCKKLKSKLCLQLESEEILEQLSQVINFFDIRLEKKLILSRCIICNSQLIKVPKSFAKLRVPPYVFEKHRTFKFCEKCDKFYWWGTHTDKIISRIRALNDKARAKPEL